MEKEKMVEQITLIDKLVRETIRSNQPNVIPVLDGIVDLDKYLTSKYKILWILKEPNDKEPNKDGVRGAWDLREYIGNRLTEYRHGKWKRTFGPIIKTVWAINHNFSTDNMPPIEENEMLSILQNVAFINIKKLSGLSRCNEKELNEIFERDRNLLIKQIEVYNPDILIFAGTSRFIRTFLPPNYEKVDHFYIANNKVYITSNHPNQRSIKQKEYCNLILKACSYYNTMSTAVK